MMALLSPLQRRRAAQPKVPSQGHPTPTSIHQQVLALQQHLGNQAVMRLLDTVAQPPTAPAAPIQRAVDIASGPQAGRYTSASLRALLDNVAVLINKSQNSIVKRGPLDMVHAAKIYPFATLQKLAEYMTAPYEMYIEPTDFPLPELAYGAEHGDYHFTGKVTKQKAQWTLAKGTALQLMADEVMKHWDRIKADSKPDGWDSWYVGGDNGKPVGDTVAGPVSTFTMQVQVHLQDNLISYHGYPDQRLKKTGVGKSKSSISDDE
jgi:hypothetical protein